MKKHLRPGVFLSIILLITSQMTIAQKTIFEKTNGRETATYFEVIDFYTNLAKKSAIIKMETKGLTDSGYPLHLILISSDKQFDPVEWHKQGKVVFMINNGIHPGEPDGIDASMMLVRDIINKKVELPNHVAIGVIPIYNIGGALNRSGFSRVNQEGPLEYGFRGNAQNRDLNRDFTKNDTKNARSFAEIFHYLNPDVLVDTHVSDGADYQHTMTLITTQYNKQGPLLGEWVKQTFEPALFEGMKNKKHEMVPYVNVDGTDPSVGFSQFNDAPRYSSGYAALFNTISFMPETHMLKPYQARTQATYDLLTTFIETNARFASEIKEVRKKAIENTVQQKEFPLSWKLDPKQFTEITFKGYESGSRTSKVTGLPILFYDHSKPFTKQVKFYDVYTAQNIVSKPKAYIIPQGWWKVLDILSLNKVKMERMKNDSVIEVNAFRIDNLKAMPNAYEGHYKNTKVEIGVVRKGLNNEVEFEITRGDIPIYSIDISYMIEPETGFIKISRFANKTYNEFMDGMKKLQKEGAKKVIVDLRQNPGGSLVAVLQMLDEFLEKDEPILYTEGVHQPRKTYNASGRNTFKDIEVYVMIDEFSASASEIFAGAIQDNDRGIVIGRRSFGKGLVQEQIPLMDGSALRLTVARFYTPSGRCIQSSYENGNEEYYSNIYKRFHHMEQLVADSIHFADSLKYETKGGRTVYGGGGIMPDIFVPADTTGNSEYFTSIYRKGLIYAYAYAYADENRSALAKFKTADEIERYLDNKNILNEFVKYAAAKEVPRDEQGLKDSGLIISTQLKAYIARNLIGEEGFYPIIKKIDKTLLQTIDITHKHLLVETLNGYTENTF